MHDSWKSMKTNGWLQSHKFCPLCGNEHTLVVFGGKTYCMENHVNDSGWSPVIYDALVSDPKNAESLIVGNDRTAQEDRRKVSLVLLRLDQKKTTTLHEKMTACSLDAAQKIAQEMVAKILEKERKKLEEEYEAKNKHADQHYSNYWSNYWKNYWSQQLIQNREEQNRFLRKQRDMIRRGVEDAIY